MSKPKIIELTDAAERKIATEMLACFFDAVPLTSMQRELLILSAAQIYSKGKLDQLSKQEARLSSALADIIMKADGK